MEGVRQRVVVLAGTHGSSLYITSVDTSGKGIKFWYTGDPSKAVRLSVVRAEEIASKINAGGKHRARATHESEIGSNPVVTIGRRRRVPRPPLPFLTGGDVYKPPTVSLGGEQPLPEKREDIVLKMLCALDTSPVYRQDFSNGEFTSNSLIVSKTVAGIGDRSKDLECAGDVAYFDPALKIFWRQGGCFD